MKTILNFLDTWSNRIVLPLVVIIFLKTCTTNSKIKNESDKIQVLQTKVDSINVMILNQTKEIKKEILIEGLKSEKRMIQSTDRKILDVNRQSEIDKEISKIEN